MTIHSAEMVALDRAIRRLRKTRDAVNRSVDERIAEMQAQLTKLINANRQASGLPVEE